MAASYAKSWCSAKWRPPAIRRHGAVVRRNADWGSLSRKRWQRSQLALHEIMPTQTRACHPTASTHIGVWGGDEAAFCLFVARCAPPNFPLGFATLFLSGAQRVRVGNVSREKSLRPGMTSLPGGLLSRTQVATAAQESRLPAGERAPFAWARGDLFSRSRALSRKRGRRAVRFRRWSGVEEHGRWGKGES